MRRLVSWAIKFEFSIEDIIFEENNQKNDIIFVFKIAFHLNARLDDKPKYNDLASW